MKRKKLFKNKKGNVNNYILVLMKAGNVIGMDKSIILYTSLNGDETIEFTDLKLRSQLNEGDEVSIIIEEKPSYNHLKLGKGYIKQIEKYEERPFYDIMIEDEHYKGAIIL